MSPQELTSLISAVFIVGMIWLRPRMHYAQRSRGRLQLSSAGRIYFVVVLLVLGAGWLAAPPLAHAAWPATPVSPTLARVVCFLATYYLFIAVHRMIQAQGVSVFKAAKE